MKQVVSAFLLTLIVSSCSFYSIKHSTSNELGVIEAKTCNKLLFGIPFKQAKSPIELAKENGIDNISLISSEFFFPLIPIYVSDCLHIAGTTKRSFQERREFIHDQIQTYKRIRATHGGAKKILTSREAEKCKSGDKESCWNLAYKLALLDREKDSLKMLERAFELGWNNWDHLEKDDDINNLRDNPKFKKLVEKYKNGN